MKKVVIMLVVLVVAAGANAALKISVNGVVDPPDTVVFWFPSDVIIIDIYGVEPAQPMGTFFLGINAGVFQYASMNIDTATIPYPGNTKSIGWLDDPDSAALLGVKNPFVMFELVDLVTPPAVPKPLLGLLVDYIKFHNDGTFSDITLSLFDIEGNVLDAQVIHIPEPVTIALLGLGGLLVRRRK